MFRVTFIDSIYLYNKRCRNGQKLDFSVLYLIGYIINMIITTNIVVIIICYTIFRMSSNIDWNDVIKKEARGVNGEDFGEVHDVSNGYVFVQKGIINKEKFFIPQDKVESYDGDVLRFNISHDEALSTYQGESFPNSSSSSQMESTPVSYTSESEEMTVPIIEERLEVNKRVEENHATITKEPVTETKTVEVSVTHEEVSIETRKPTGDTSTSQEAITSRQEIEIPLKKEEVEVSKTPYVKEEVVIKKKPVTETREFTEEIRSEQVNTESISDK